MSLSAGNDSPWWAAVSTCSHEIWLCSSQTWQRFYRNHTQQPHRFNDSTYHDLYKTMLYQVIHLSLWLKKETLLQYPPQPEDLHWSAKDWLYELRTLNSLCRQSAGSKKAPRGQQIFSEASVAMFDLLVFGGTLWKQIYFHIIITKINLSRCTWQDSHFHCPRFVWDSERWP